MSWKVKLPKDVYEALKTLKARIPGFNIHAFIVAATRREILRISGGSKNPNG